MFFGTPVLCLAGLMRRHSTKLLILNTAALLPLLFFLITYAAEGLAWAEKPVFADVLRVNDGDSISVRLAGKKEKIRLIGIDAPEIRQRPWGQMAKKHLMALIGRSSVKIETDIVKRDRYGRLLAYVWTADGRFVNLEMLRDGYAVIYTFPPNVNHLDELRAAQAEAKGKKTGIWGPDGLKKMPRHYRREHLRN